MGRIALTLTLALALAAHAAEAGDAAAIADETSTLVAESPARGWLAVVQQRSFGCGCNPHHESALVVFTRAGAVVAEISLANDADAGDWEAVHGGAGDATHARWRAHERPRIAARVKRANRYLRDNGFVSIAGAVRAQRTDAGTLRFPGLHLGIAVDTSGMARLLRKDDTLSTRRLHTGCAGPRGEQEFLCQYPPGLDWAIWLPAQQTILLQWTSPGAEHTEMITTLEIWPVTGAGAHVVSPAGADPQHPASLGA